MVGFLFKMSSSCSNLASAGYSGYECMFLTSIDQLLLFKFLFMVDLSRLKALGQPQEALPKDVSFFPHLFWTSFITRKFVNELSDCHWNTFWGYSRDHWSCSSWTAAEADFMGKRDVTTVWLVSKYDSSTDLWLAVRLMRWTLVWVSQVTFAVEGGYSNWVR